MAELDQEIAAYDAMSADLEAQHIGKWALVRDRKLVGIYDSFEKAAEEAVSRFGRGPYLIRQVGAPKVTLPASSTITLLSPEVGRACWSLGDPL